MGGLCSAVWDGSHSLSISASSLLLLFFYVLLFSTQISKTTLICPPVLSYYSNNIKKNCTCVCVCVHALLSKCPSDHHRKLAYQETGEHTEESNCAFGRPRWLPEQKNCLFRGLGKQGGSQIKKIIMRRTWGRTERKKFNLQLPLLVSSY